VVTKAPAHRQSNHLPFISSSWRRRCRRGSRLVGARRRRGRRRAPASAARGSRRTPTHRALRDVGHLGDALSTDRRRRRRRRRGVPRRRRYRQSRRRLPQRRRRPQRRDLAARHRRYPEHNLSAAAWTHAAWIYLPFTFHFKPFLTLFSKVANAPTAHYSPLHYATATLLGFGGWLMIPPAYAAAYRHGHTGVARACSRADKKSTKIPTTIVAYIHVNELNARSWLIAQRFGCFSRGRYI